jgi:F-type H+-transporting ATPase subunit gamma
MPNILDLRRRIRSVTNTRQITKAMKMVSAARLRRAQERALQARPFARMLTNVLESLMRRTDIHNGYSGNVIHPLLEEREEKNVLVVFVAGDKGFAGAFNSNIVRAGQSFIGGRIAQGKTVDMELIGRKAVAHVGKRFPMAVYEKKTEHYDNQLATHYEIVRHRSQPVEVAATHADLLHNFDIEKISNIAHSIIDRYSRKEIDSVYMVYNEFKSVITQRVVVEKLLPIRKLGSPEITAAEEMTEEHKEAIAHAAASSGISANVLEDSVVEAEAKKFGTAEVDYIFDQSPARIFRHLMPRYVTTQIFHALLESVAAEHAARMTAMDAATNNASDLIDSLTLAMNRVRQAKITREIIEIVSGADAL